MNHTITNYLHSFKLNRNFWYTFILEAAAIAAIVLIILAFGNILTAKAYAISGGKSPDELKLMLLSGTEETAKDFLSKIKIFTVLFVGGGILLIVILLMLFSLAQKSIWDKLTAQKFSWLNFWRWNMMTLLLILFFIIYILVYAIFRLTINLLIPLTGTAYTITWQIINLFFLLTFLLFFFITLYSLAEKHKVWEAIGNTFHSIKSHWNKLWKLFLLSWAALILLSLIIWLLSKGLSLVNIFFSATAWTVITAAFFLAFVSWMRNYTVKELSPKLD
jgi:hypothetical protein